MPVFTVSDQVASVKTIYVNTPMDEVLQEFPDLTALLANHGTYDIAPSTTSEQRQVPQCLAVHVVSLQIASR